MIGTPSKGGKHRPGRGAPTKPRSNTEFTAGPKGSKSPAARTSQTGPKGKKKKGGRKERGFFRRFWWAFVAVPVVAFLGLFLTLLYVYAHTKLPDLPPGPQTTIVYDQTGKVLATLHAEVNRTIIPFSQMSDSVKNAVIAVEDKNYYHEGGVSYFGIVRAAWADLRHRQIQQGGSTITQQYVKNVITGSERSFARKVKEAILAVKLSHKYSKQQILEKYLNTVYFGNGAYGVEAAAETYWGIPASKLDNLKSATLAGLIAAPAIFDPVRNPSAARDRRDVVLTDMAQQGYITATEAARLKSQPVRVRKPSPQTFPHGYFVDYVSRALQTSFGEAATFTGGLRVTTTLNLAYQEAAEKAIADHLPSPSDPAAALVAIDPSTGAIRAMVGGRDFAKQKVNYATQALRQAGSSFKPFTLAAAMEQKISLNSVWNGPSVIDIKDPRCRNPDGTDWMPHNYADESGGTMILTQATAHSVNTIFAQLVTTVGPPSVVDMAQRMGIRTELKPVCSITLGSQGVTPLDMADSYATLAARGMHRSPISIATVRSSSGLRIFRANPLGQQVMLRNDADLVTSALQHVITEGTGTAAAIGRPAAGKTGTAENYVDAWFCGYTPQLATCVWMGYPKSEKVPMVNVEGFPQVFGGSIPARIWHDFMSTAMLNVPVANFATPSLAGYNVNPPGAASPTPSPSPSPSPKPSPSPSLPSPTPSLPSPTPSTSPLPSPSVSPSKH